MSPLTFKGLFDFQEYMSNLPQALNDEASEIVRDAATGALGETYVAYPKGKTGDLRRELTIDFQKGATRTTARVISGSDHANEYEKGSGPRSTRRGWSRGSMPRPPSGQALIPIARKWRRRMVNELIAMVERSGFKIEHR